LAGTLEEGRAQERETWQTLNPYIGSKPIPLDVIATKEINDVYRDADYGMVSIQECSEAISYSNLLIR